MENQRQEEENEKRRDTVRKKLFDITKSESEHEETISSTSTMREEKLFTMDGWMDEEKEERC